MNETPIRAVIYARLSVAKRKEVDDETSESVENQVNALTALAERSGYVLGEVYADDGKSGFKGVHRKGFTSMLAAMKRREFDLILVRHADRFSRNDGDSSTIRTACALYGVRWQTADGAITDPGGSSGSFSAKVLAAVAELESQIKSERLREHYAAKVARGELLPRGDVFGYSDENRSRVVPWEADRIRAAYEAVAAGASVGSIVRGWNAAHVPHRRGSTRWTYAHVNAILRRHRNAGIIAHRGQPVDVLDPSGEPLRGKWEAIVSPDLFAQVNAILDSRRGTGHGFTSQWLSSGIAKCGTCGAAMRSNTATDKRRGTRTPILRCSAIKSGQVHGCAILADLEPLVRREVLQAFMFGPARIFAEQRDDHAARIYSALSDVQAAREDVLALIGPNLTRTQAGARLAALNAEESALRESLRDAQGAASVALLQDITAELWSERGRVSYEAGARTLSALGKRFDDLGIEARRALVGRLLEITVQRGRGPDKYEIRHRVVTSLNEERIEVSEAVPA